MGRLAFIRIDGQDDQRWEHLNSMLFQLTHQLNKLSVSPPTIVDTSIQSDQGFSTGADVVEYIPPPDDTAPETDNTPEVTQGPPTMAGYSPSVTMHKDGKHAIVDWSTWPGVGDKRITHYKVYASTTTPCPIDDSTRKKTVTRDHTSVEITTLSKGSTYDFRVCPLYKSEGSKKEILGLPSD